jgi:hypothetical protein
VTAGSSIATISPLRRSGVRALGHKLVLLQALGEHLAQRCIVVHDQDPFHVPTPYFRFCPIRLVTF